VTGWWVRGISVRARVGEQCALMWRAHDAESDGAHAGGGGGVGTDRANPPCSERGKVGR
jgi:hypothetical protein